VRQRAGVRNDLEQLRYLLRCDQRDSHAGLLCWRVTGRHSDYFVKTLLTLQVTGL
jgi:hypothetical protein